VSSLPRDDREKELWRDQRSQVRDILMEHWDPIGVSGIPEAADEYDTYVGYVVGALRNGRSIVEIENHMRWVASEHMRLGPLQTDYTDLMKRLLDLRIGA
jgi:hypothetical protein